MEVIAVKSENGNGATIMYRGVKYVNGERHLLDRYFDVTSDPGRDTKINNPNYMGRAADVNQVRGGSQKASIAVARKSNPINNPVARADRQMGLTPNRRY